MYTTWVSVMFPGNELFQKERQNEKKTNYEFWNNCEVPTRILTGKYKSYNVT